LGAGVGVGVGALAEVVSSLPHAVSDAVATSAQANRRLICCFMVSPWRFDGSAATAAIGIGGCEERVRRVGAKARLGID
jgi:hypothetical protein